MNRFKFFQRNDNSYIRDYNLVQYPNPNSSFVTNTIVFRWDSDSPIHHSLRYTFLTYQGPISRFNAEYTRQRNDSLTNQTQHLPLVPIIVRISDQYCDPFLLDTDSNLSISDPDKIVQITYRVHLIPIS